MIVNDVLQDGRTALGWAIYGKDPHFALMLVAAGADVLTSQVSYSPFACTLLAVYRGRSKCGTDSACCDT